jgi:hypothetical protein
LTRGQRGAHAFIWSALAVVLALILAGALGARDRIDHAARDWAEKSAR